MTIFETTINSITDLDKEAMEKAGISIIKLTSKEEDVRFWVLKKL